MSCLRASLRRALRTSVLVMLVHGLSANLHAGGAAVGGKFPDLSKFGVEGKLPALAGKVVLVDFWASWCAPCRRSFPELDALYRKYHAQGFEVVGVSVDEKAGDMKTFTAANKVSFATVRDATQKLAEAAGPETMPTSFLVDQTGVVRLVEVGFRGKPTVQELDAAIQKLLKK
jgi:thiol-disulfide isomerase/thioredoxin